MFRSLHLRIFLIILVISFGMHQPTSYADQALDDALKTIDDLFPGQLINNPFDVNWYKVGDKTKLKNVKAKGIPGETAIRFENKKAKTNAWDAIAGSPVNASVGENEVIYVAFWAKGKKRNKDRFSQATVRIAENKAPYTHIIDEQVEFTDSWALYYLKGRATRSFQADELDFSIQMGLHKQSVDVGQYYVVNLGTNGNTDTLPIYKKVQAVTQSNPTVNNSR